MTKQATKRLGQNRTMAIKIPVAHDFICPWCWIALSQADRLEREFDVEFEWVAYELMPEGMEWPEPSIRRQPVPNKPPTPSRLDLALAAEGLAPLSVARPQHMRTHCAHVAVEYAKTLGKGYDLLKSLYRKLYLEGAEINNPDVIENIAKPIVSDVKELRRAIAENRFADKITPFDDEAYASGVYNVPTFFIGGERYAEQPYSVLREAVSRVAERRPGFWRGLAFESAQSSRPYTAIVMAETLDGAVALAGKPFIGSSDDLVSLRTLEEQFDASLVGAETIRKAPSTWYSRSAKSFVLSRSGDLPANWESVKRSQVVGSSALFDLKKWLESLKQEGVRSLLIEGGPRVNRQFLDRGLVDELFITVTPAIGMADPIHTLAGLSESGSRPIQLSLVSEHRWGDEMFLRYRVVRP